MRHQAENVAGFVTDAGDVLDRAVRVGGGGDIPLGITVTDDDLVMALELRDHGRLGKVAALAMGDRDPQHLALAALAGKR